MLNSEQLFQDATMRSVGLTAGLVFVTAGAMWRSSRVHVTIFQTIFFGGLGIWGNMHTTMQVLNSEWADQKPLVTKVFIVDRSIIKNKKHTMYFLTLQALAENLHKKIEVSEKVYYDTGTHASLNLTLQQGALGYLIIKKISVSTAVIDNFNVMTVTMFKPKIKSLTVIDM